MTKHMKLSRASEPRSSSVLSSIDRASIYRAFISSSCQLIPHEYFNVNKERGGEGVLGC